MKDNRIPTHLSTTTDIRDMLKEIAEKEERTMRKVLERIIRKEYERVIRAGEST